MDDLLHSLRDIAAQLDAVVSDAFGQVAVRGLRDDELVAVMDAAGQVLRRAQGMLAETAGEVELRSGSAERAERLTTRLGCASTRELLQRVTRVSARSASEIVHTGRAIRARSSATGGLLPARYPALRDALAAGGVSADAVCAVTVVLDAATTSAQHLAAADAELAAAARGEGAQSGPPPSADELRLQAQVWAAYLDPDGAEPRDEAAQRQRGVSLGRCRDGLVPLRGSLLPDVAAQLQRTFDAILDPRGSGPVFTDDADLEAQIRDPRTAAQKRHDALATIATTAARSGELPSIGGAAPTLVVSVRADDLASGRGVAHVDGVDEPVPLSVARQVACTGGVHRVTLDSGGRITALRVSDRVFTAHQRKAIALRDGGCVIPGCRVRAAWCEIHHVQEASRGGPTSTDNGVLLCWHHHRTLDRSGWQIRMRLGIPEIRGPAWWDPARRWRAATTSPTRMRERHEVRMRQ